MEEAKFVADLCEDSDEDIEEISEAGRDSEVQALCGVSTLEHLRSNHTNA